MKRKWKLRFGVQGLAGFRVIFFKIAAVEIGESFSKEGTHTVLRNPSIFVICSGGFNCLTDVLDFERFMV